MVELGFFEEAHTVHDGALAGENEGVGRFGFGRGGDEARLAAHAFKSTQHTAQVAHAVINYGKVEGGRWVVRLYTHGFNQGVMLPKIGLAVNAP